MSYVTTVTIIGTLAGVVGTGLGGLISIIAGNRRDSTLGFVLAFSGGVMLSVVFADLFPEALRLGGIPTSLVGLSLGIALLLLLDLYLPHSHFLSLGCNDRHSRFLQSSLLLGLGIAMHNLPEGLAIGAGYAVSEHLGLGLAIIIAIQNVPEGMAMGGPMKAACIDDRHILLWSCLAGVPMGLGALMGAALGTVSPRMLSLALGLAAGAMLYITFDELLPEAHELSSGGHASTFGAMVGAVLGLLLILLLPGLS
ncbi:MAG: ZIP family metal transporter [Firmicutes bacterium]|jgi:ZIP family zinc transporter|nr:ZIP family metal transporter [Bacillota bacterium]